MRVKVSVYTFTFVGMPLFIWVGLPVFAHTVFHRAPAHGYACANVPHCLIVRVYEGNNTKGNHISLRPIIDQKISSNRIKPEAKRHSELSSRQRLINNVITHTHRMQLLARWSIRVHSTEIGSDRKNSENLISLLLSLF